MYDFTALNTPLAAEDTAAYARAFPNDKHHLGDYITVVVIFLIVIFTSLLLIIGLALDIPFGWSGVLDIFFTTLLVTLLMVAFLVLDRSRSMKRRAKLYRFTTANNAQFRRGDSPSKHAGIIFPTNGSGTITESIQFANGLEIGVLHSDEYDGRFSSSAHYTYATISLGKHVPNMILDSVSNNFLSISSLPDTFSKSQQLSLEGDFNSHYSLYVPKQYETDALYIFTPDVMQALIAISGKYDIEVVDDKMYLYSKQKIDLTSEVELREIMSIMQTLTAELNKQTALYQDERVPTVQRAVQPIAAQGKRLRSSVGMIAILLTLVFITARIQGIAGDGSSLIEITGAVLGFASILGIVFSVTISAIRD